MGFSSKSLESGVKKKKSSSGKKDEKSTQLIQLRKGEKKTKTPAAWPFDLGGFRPVFQRALSKLCVCVDTKTKGLGQLWPMLTQD